MEIPLLLALPWLTVLLFLLFVARLPRELAPLGRAESPLLVSVIVPARNEAINIEACVRSLAASTYPSFEVIVVDDRSEDGTAAIVRSLETASAGRVRLVEGVELPPGWLGKPWACAQGAAVAEGEILLFTDADTRHAPGLLTKAVAGLDEEGADLLTLVGRQLMDTFWERVVQPQIFMMMFFRFPRFDWTAASPRWREAIANGQYLLFRRSAYETIGGHEAVKDEVVEDLALAQRVKREGLRLRIRGAQEDLATRMYRSLPDLVQGWTKNIVTGGLQSLPPRLRGVMPPLAFASGIGLWVAPPLLLLWAISGHGPDGTLLWSGSVCALSVIIWMSFTSRMGAPAVYGLLYPVGAVVGAYIFARAWLRGRTVEWKGRRYELPSMSTRV